MSIADEERVATASPGGEGAVAAAEFFRINSTRGTFREMTFSTRNPLPLLILCALKVLRVRVPCSCDDPAVSTLAPFEADFATASQEVARRVAPDLAALRVLGFDGPVMYQAVDEVLNSTVNHLFTTRDPGGRSVARVHLRLSLRRQPPKAVQFVEFLTPLADGGYVWTLSSKPDTIEPRQCRVVRKVGAAPADLLALHERAVAGAAAAALPVSDDGAMRSVVEAHHRLVSRFHLERGVFAPQTESERREVAAKLEVRRLAAAGGLPDADVLAEIDRLQRKRSGWWGTLLMLVVSLGAFVGLGKSGSPNAMADSWEMMAILVGVLFFHELGHYVAMRVFGYRNLRMFFIPFFGAAVSGRHYNVAGWKKAVVSLMGPVPGIALGVVLGLTGLVLKNDLMVRVGVLALILNGFNLLPVLPLDGGWVAHTVVFSRNYVLDAIFRVLAAGALIGAGVYGHVRFLPYLGIGMLVALPVTMRIARIVAELRRDGVRSTSPDDQTIPPDVAQAIVGKLRRALPKRGVSTKILAQHTMTAYEALNARPPGWLATIGLGTVHVGSFLAALVFAVVLVMGQRGDLGRIARAARQMNAEPKHSVVASAVRTWPEEGSSSAAAEGRRRTVLATFDAPGKAADAFDGLRTSLPESSMARLFGDSVMVSVPAGDDAARRKALSLLRGRTRNVRVVDELPGTSARFSCVAPDQRTAETLAAEAADYLGAAGMHLIPPWASVDPRGDAERARQALARRTYGRVLEAERKAYGGTDERKDYARALVRARQDGDQSEMERLEAAQQKELEGRQDRAVRALRDEGEGNVDVGVIDKYVELARARRAATAPAAEDEEPDVGGLAASPLTRRAKELGPLLGQLALGPDGNPLPGQAARESAVFGSAKQDGRHVRLTWVMLRDPFDGGPAVARWMARHGCTQVKYDFGDADGEEGAE